MHEITTALIMNRIDDTTNPSRTVKERAITTPNLRSKRWIHNHSLAKTTEPINITGDETDIRTPHLRCVLTRHPQRLNITINTDHRPRTKKLSSDPQNTSTTTKIEDDTILDIAPHIRRKEKLGSNNRRSLVLLSHRVSRYKTTYPFKQDLKTLLPHSVRRVL